MTAGPGGSSGSTGPTPIVLGTLGLGWIGAGIWLALAAASNLPSKQCSGTLELPNVAVLVIFGVGLLLGGIFGFLRRAAIPGRPAPGKRGQLVATVAAALLFLLAAIVFYYEALGVAGVSYAIGDARAFFQPITYYVRCAISYDFDPFGQIVVHLPLVTSIVVAVYGLLLGHWFCYPAIRAGVRRRSVQSHAFPGAE